ncbi:alpha amylase C-terminal domain-containing protein [uncultured Desulfobacter sp.]|uniref:alpha amylase C-terminal domain-containing protein n=1 Tax=uncultured Desulfobacter sp. TaxID=240139 RepID=UPI003749E4DC
MLESRPFDPAKWHFDWNQTNSGYVQAFRDLIHLRTDSDGPTGGLSSNQYYTLHENHDAKVLAYSRSDQIVVVLNFGNVHYKSYWLPFPIHGHWQLLFSGDNKKYDPQFKNRYSDVVETNAYKAWKIAGEINLAPYSGVIYVFDQNSWAKDDSIYK